MFLIFKGKRVSTVDAIFVYYLCKETINRTEKCKLIRQQFTITNPCKVTFETVIYDQIIFNATLFEKKKKHLNSSSYLNLVFLFAVAFNLNKHLE